MDNFSVISETKYFPAQKAKNFTKSLKNPYISIIYFTQGGLDTEGIN